MRKIAKYIGTGLLALTIASCKDEPKPIEKYPEIKVAIVEVIKNIKTGQEFNINYTRVGTRLRSSLNEFVERDDYNCVIRYHGSIPGSMTTCVYGDRIWISFKNSSSRRTIIDDDIRSKEVEEYKTRYEKDVSLLRKAGLGNYSIYFFRNNLPK